MKRGRGIVRRQAGGRGLFAEVVLEAEPGDRRAWAIELEENADGRELDYEHTLRAAVTLVEEKARSGLRRPELGRLRVTLRKLVATTADTTCTAVFLAAVRALEDALDIEVPDIEPDWAARELRIRF